MIVLTVLAISCFMHGQWLLGLFFLLMVGALNDGN